MILKVLALVSASLAILCSLPHSPVRAAVVITANGPQAGSGDPPSSSMQIVFAPSQGAGARNLLPSAQQSDDLSMLGQLAEVDVMTPTDVIPIICDGLQNSANECRSVLPFSDYMAQKGNRERLTSLLSERIGAQRKRRSIFPSLFDRGDRDPWTSSFFDESRPLFPFGTFGNFGNDQPHNPHNPNPSSSGGYNPPPYPQFPGYPGHGSYPGHASVVNTPVLVCPTPQKQSEAFQLRSDSANYPAQAIANLLATNSALLGCFLNQVVLGNTPPLVQPEAFAQNATYTCPFTQSRLAQYRSSSQNQDCWVVHNYGDIHYYRTCLTQFCRNCSDNAPDASASPHLASGPRPQSFNQKLCVPEYRAVSVWAYCPWNHKSSQLIRDRLILPFACTCQSVACSPLKDS